MERRLYPLKFTPIASRRPWGGNYLAKKLGKHFTEEDADGKTVEIPADEIIGESWELADMGAQDSVIENGWLAGNTIGEIMETYMERVVGDDVFNTYGTQFPLLIKFLDINDKLSVQVHPDDEVGIERYDSLGKAEVWYVIDNKPGACVYMGFKKAVSSQEFYDACRKGTADKLLNRIEPHKGDVIFIHPGTVHAADGGLQICEIQESSDLTFRLYDWGRELNPATARKMHLEEAIDLINYDSFDAAAYTPAGEAVCNGPVQQIADCPQFSVNKLTLSEDTRISGDRGSFVVYSCISGEVSLQIEEDGKTAEYRLRKGDTMLVPAECPGFILSPIIKNSELICSTTRPRPATDSYTGEISDTKE